ncbi:MAG: RHS repeat-associated core domain-containing protein, partial [Flavobacteriales bacterium]
TLLSNGEIVAVGDQASIHKASGTMRMAVNEIYLSGMNDVHFHDADHGYAVGDHMVVRYTNNGGQTWQPVPSNETVAGTVSQRNLNAVYTSSPTQGIAVGQFGKRKTLSGTSMATLDQPMISSGSALHWNDVTVSPAGAVLIVGELSGAGRHVTKLPSSSSYSGLVSSTVPLRKIWHWQPFPINGTMQEEYLVGNLNGNLRLVKRQPTPSAPFDATQITGTQPASLLSGAVTAMWFHDRSTGFVATTPGRLYRLTYADPDHHNGTVVMTPSATDLGVGGSGIWPDDLDGQTVANNIRINTIQFADRHLGFLGGAYTGTPVRYARTIRDEIGLYSQRFWYDKLGRLVLSQNTKQFERSPKRYSYSRYDQLGRVFESGEVEEGGFAFKDIFGSDVEGEFQNTAIEQENLEAFLHAGPRFEVTRTHYDRPFYEPIASDIDDQFLAGEQQHLRLRVASTTYEEQYDEIPGTPADEDPTTYEHATHYSYDIHGNVKELVQESKAMGEDAPDPGQAFKHIAYTYDLVSGNVHQVDYQDNKPDQFHHRYTYDADNRITKVETNRSDKDDEAAWREDGAYFYYPHGPLLRTEVAEHKVQGIDYAYTLQGWLKAINSNGLQQNQDMGHDSDPDLVDNPHAAVARDAFGLSLHYFDPAGGDAEKDYYPISDAVWNNATGQRFIAKGPLSENGRDLYNGNIAAMVRSLPPTNNWYADAVNEGTPQILGWRFKYDQLNRLREANTRKGLNAANDWTDVGVVDALYKSQYTYDANGNILTAKRWDHNNDLYDDLIYQYSRSVANGGAGGKLWRNRLYHLKDAGADNLVTQADDGTEDLLFNSTEMADVETDPLDENASGSNNHYQYDELGNLIRDQREGLAHIDWTATGKVRTVQQAALSGERYHLRLGYGVGNHRITKTVSNDLGTELALQHREHYVHDAQGNVMAIYRYTPAPDQNSPLSFTVTQRPIYGSSRLGLDDWDQEAHDPNYDENQATGDGKVRYELTDHLGNLLAVVTDDPEGYSTDADPEAEEWHAGLLSAQEYEPFGSLLPGRNYSSDVYRFGFQGQEKDDEVFGSTGTAISFEYRVHDPRVGRFLSIDPLAAKYPWFTPYQFAGNKPTWSREIEGLESEVDAPLGHCLDANPPAASVPSDDPFKRLVDEFEPENLIPHQLLQYVADPKWSRENFTAYDWFQFGLQYATTMVPWGAGGRVTQATSRVGAEGVVGAEARAVEAGAARNAAPATGAGETTAVQAAELKPYGGPGGGHHVPAKSAFVGAPGYNVNTALAVPNAELVRLGVSHSTVTGAQATLYRSFAKSGSALSWDVMAYIETKALVAGGMEADVASSTVNLAIKNLREAGVAGPTRIPWGGQ